ncbi:MAG: GAF domain-containing protein [Polyangiaceae bacterium]|nr:GAF domain-containing protein [Polyangiaceae bacterium]
MAKIGEKEHRLSAPRIGVAPEEEEAPAFVASATEKLNAQSEGSLSRRAARFELLHRVGIALGAESNRERLLSMILEEARQLCQADGGTLYLRTADDHLQFSIIKNISLQIDLGGTSEKEIPFPPLPLYDPLTGKPNHQNVASHTFHQKEPVHIPDAYHAQGFDFRGTKDFDRRNGYESRSFFAVPLINSADEVIGVIQLLNAQDSQGRVVAFEKELQEIVAALAAQAALALDNKLLLEAQKELLESFIKLIATAIDSKSPYTGGHCERVPVLTEMLVQSLCDTQTGPYGDFQLDSEEWYELRIAAWLHDCGKVTTPVHVMDKSTKLETIHDRINEVRTRIEVLKRDAEVIALQAQLDGCPAEKARHEQRVAEEQLDEALRLLERANIGGEFLAPAEAEKIREIAQKEFFLNGNSVRLLSDEEVENLCVSKGTLTEDERLVINGHMVQTLRMLEALPFPRNLRRVPEYAGGHHEKMDGSGYPKGLFAGDMSIPARAMAIADVFEALTAHDRPYKKAKTLSESMRIMGFMKKDNHLDPLLFDHFVTSKTYLKYAEEFLSPELIDPVDEEALLKIIPRPYEVPEAEVRQERWHGFLEKYEKRFPLRGAKEREGRVSERAPE